MRWLVLELAGRLGLRVEPRGVMLEELTADGGASEVFVTNAVRGLQPVGRVGERAYAAPGPVTAVLDEALAGWLQERGVEVP
jgi:branched-subunit amino acid aminotransferase/4-amino-4-deoxychorismate lyase